MTVVNRRFVFRDQDGVAVETWAARSREEAIARFCYPALTWAMFEADGWTCNEEPGQPPATFREYRRTSKRPE